MLLKLLQYTPFLFGCSRAPFARISINLSTRFSFWLLFHFRKTCLTLSSSIFVVFYHQNEKITKFNETFSNFHVRQYYIVQSDDTRMHLSCMLHTDDIIIFRWNCSGPFRIYEELYPLARDIVCKQKEWNSFSSTVEDISKFVTFGNEHFNFITKLKSVNLKAL